MTAIDDAAEAANANLRDMNAQWDAHARIAARHRNRPDLTTRALVNIACQLAYANTVAAAEFYMTHVHIDEEN